MGESICMATPPGQHGKQNEATKFPRHHRIGMATTPNGKHSHDKKGRKS